VNDKAPASATLRPGLLWWRGQDLNLRPSGYESDAPCFMGFLDPPWSRQIGLFSTIVAVDARSRCHRGADPV